MVYKSHSQTYRYTCILKIIEYILVGDGIGDGTCRCDGMEGWKGVMVWW